MGRLGGSAVDPLRASPNRLIQVLVFSFERGRRLMKAAPATPSLSRVANGCRTSIAQPIPPTTPASRCARAGQAPPHRAALLGLSQDRQAPRKEAGPRAGAGRWDGGTEARRPAVDQARSPLVDRAVVPATEHTEIRQRGGTALRPVTNVMALSEADPTAREAAAA